MDSKHEAAGAYANAANCYKKTNSKGINCVDFSLWWLIPLFLTQISIATYMCVVQLKKDESIIKLEF